MGLARLSCFRLVNAGRAAAEGSTAGGVQLGQAGVPAHTGGVSLGQGEAW